MKILCKTYFDITATGVTGHFRGSRLPFVDRAGQTIVDEYTWNRARNQQRNWETLTQLISLRTQVFDLQPPVTDAKEWEFSFATESDSLFELNGDPLGQLIQDCNGVPMLLGLDETIVDYPGLVTTGTVPNIWFTINNYS